MQVYLDIPHETSSDYRDVILEHPDGTQITLIDEIYCDQAGPTVLSVKFDDSGVPYFGWFQ